jgi:hypothetical protein
MARSPGDEVAFAGTALRGVEADELYLRAETESVKQSVIQDRVLRSAHLSKLRTQVEVVINLLAIKALFVIVLVMIADSGKNRYAVDDVAKGLKVSEEPIIVLIAAGADRDSKQGFGVDVVAGRQN